MKGNRFEQRRSLTLGAMALATQAIWPGAARAQSGFPAKPLRLIVPFPAGGGADVPARHFAQRLSARLNQTILVDNKVGADGAIAALDAARSAPDGHTIFFATATSLSFVPATRKDPGYKVADFAPITHFVSFAFFLVVHESLPGKNLKEVLDHVRANPGKYAYGTGNSSSIITMAHIKERAKVDMMWVPYKGEGPGVVDLVSGRIHLMMFTGTVTPQTLKDGKCRAICVILRRRSPLMPNVPTLEESSGIPMPEVASWGGFLAPAHTPPDIVGQLSREMRATMDEPETKAKIEGYGLEVRGDTPEEFGQFMRQQEINWRKAAKAANLPVEV
jgi:tripartite-type tricarboxylate transporter receptor subunit TctC